MDLPFFLILEYKIVIYDILYRVGRLVGQIVGRVVGPIVGSIVDPILGSIVGPQNLWVT